MSELKKRIHENGIDCILVGDYYIPDIRLPETDHRTMVAGDDCTGTIYGRKRHCSSSNWC